MNSVLLQGRVHWPDFARLAAQIGFPGTDIMLRPAMQAGFSATNDLLARLKVRPAVIDFPVEFRKDDATFNSSLAQLEATAQFAAAIHCPRMKPMPNPRLRSERRFRFLCFRFPMPCAQSCSVGQQNFSPVLAFKRELSKISGPISGGVDVSI